MSVQKNTILKKMGASVALLGLLFESSFGGWVQFAYAMDSGVQPNVIWRSNTAGTMSVGSPVPLSTKPSDYPDMTQSSMDFLVDSTGSVHGVLVEYSFIPTGSLDGITKSFLFTGATINDATGVTMSISGPSVNTMDLLLSDLQEGKYFFLFTSGSGNVIEDYKADLTQLVTLQFTKVAGEIPTQPSCMNGGVGGRLTAPISDTTEGLCYSGTTLGDFGSTQDGTISYYTWSCNGITGESCQAQYDQGYDFGYGYGYGGSSSSSGGGSPMPTLSDVSVQGPICAYQHYVNVSVTLSGLTYGDQLEYALSASPERSVTGSISFSVSDELEDLGNGLKQYSYSLPLHPVFDSYTGEVLELKNTISDLLGNTHSEQGTKVVSLAYTTDCIDTDLIPRVLSLSTTGVIHPNSPKFSFDYTLTGGALTGVSVVTRVGPADDSGFVSRYRQGVTRIESYNDFPARGTITGDLMGAFADYSENELTYEVGFERQGQDFGTPLSQNVVFDPTLISSDLTPPVFTIDERSDHKNKHFYQVSETVNLTYTGVTSGNTLKVYMVGISEDEAKFETDGHTRDTISHKVVDEISNTVGGKVSFQVPDLGVGNYILKMTQASGSMLSEYRFEPRGSYDDDTMVNIVSQVEEDYSFVLSSILPFYCMEERQHDFEDVLFDQPSNSLTSLCEPRRSASSGSYLSLNLSGSVLPEAFYYEDDWKRFEFDYEILVNGNVHSTGSTNADVLSYMGVPFSPTGEEGEIQSVEIRFTDWVQRTYPTNVLNIVIDNTAPRVETSISQISDTLFQLSATGSDNQSAIKWFWFDDREGSGYSGSYLDVKTAIGTGTTLEVGTEISQYFLIAIDDAGNSTGVQVTLPNAPDPVTGLSMTGITTSGATILWTPPSSQFDGYELSLNGTLKATLGTGSTSYTFTGLTQETSYTAGIKVKKGLFSSRNETITFETPSQGVTLSLDVDPMCVDPNDPTIVRASVYRRDYGYWNDYHSKYEYMNSTHTNFLFSRLSAGEYQYSVDTGMCGRLEGSFVAQDGQQIIPLVIDAGKSIFSHVREGTQTGSLMNAYYLRLDASNNDWTQSRYVYVSNGTGKLLKLPELTYKATLYDTTTRTQKSIIGVYKSGTLIASDGLLDPSTYSTGDTLTFVVSDGNTFAGNANIPYGYIYMYDALTNNSVGSAYIKNAKFNMTGLPNGTYKMVGSSQDSRFDNLEETFVLNTSIVDKSLVFPQKASSVRMSFNKTEVFPASRVQLKMVPQGLNVGTLTFESGAELIQNATWRILDLSGSVLDSGSVEPEHPLTLSGLLNATITVDLTLKETLPANNKYLNADFANTRASAPITHVYLTAPATVKVGESFQVTGKVSKETNYEIYYQGNIIATGGTNNGTFSNTISIPTEGSGSLQVRDLAQGLYSEGSPIVVSSSIPVLSGYTVKVAGTPRITATDTVIRTFSVRVGGGLNLNSSVQVHADFAQATPDSIRYYIGGILLDEETLASGTYVGYGLKDVVVEYTVGRTTYTQIFARMVILIDPSGYVYNATENARIANMEATLYYLGDANKNLVTATGGVNQSLLSSYKTSGYTPSALTTDLSYCGESGNTCAWQKYDATGYGEEPNPQITDAEGRFSWMTPSGYYYVSFKDTDGNTGGAYADFTSPVVFIPPEVTDLNVGTNYASGYVQTENSTNYDRSRTWNGSTWGSWVYTCKNNYTGSTCTTPPSSSSTSSGGGGGGGGSYSQRATCTSSDLECSGGVWKLLSGKTCSGGNLGKSCQISGSGSTATGSMTGSLSVLTGATTPTQGDFTNTGSKQSSEEESEDFFDFTDLDDDSSEPGVEEEEGTQDDSGASLSDLEGSFAREYIKKLIDEGIAQGYIDGTFRPENTASRLEYLKMVLRAKGISYEDVDTSNLPFVDVEKESWGAKVVAKGLELGVITDENAFFRPDAPISRAEAVKMLLKVFEIEVQEVSQCDFDDVSGWAMKYVQKAKELGIISGSIEGSRVLFHPTRNISRAEVSKIIARMMEATPH